MKLSINTALSECAIRSTRILREAMRLTSFLLAYGAVLLSSAFGDCTTVGIARSADGFAQFKLGTQRYFPVGVNYFHLHLAPPYSSFDTFDPGEFNSRTIKEAFSRIKESGYNYVRLFLSGFSPDRGFDRDDRGIGEDYLENIKGTISLADKVGLHVVLTGMFRPGQWLPRNYLPRASESSVSGTDQPLLVHQYADELANFYRDLLIGLRAKGARLLSCIFYLDIYNELQFDINQRPFSLRAGRFSFDGRDYNLADPEARQQLADAAAYAWIRRVTATVRQVDRDLLVTASTFPNAAFGHAGFDGGLPTARSGNSDRNPYPIRPEVLRAGGADLLDIHLYPYPIRSDRSLPALHNDLSRVLASSEITTSTARDLPVVIGELGALRSAFATPRSAANELNATLAELCNFHVQGWAFWMWNGPGTTWPLADDLNGLSGMLRPNRQTRCETPTR